MNIGSTDSAVASTPSPLRFSTTHLLIALVLLFIAMPFAADFKYGVLAESLAVTLMLMSALMVVARRRRILVIAVLLAAPAIIGRWFDLLQPSEMTRGITTVAATLFVTFIIVQLLGFVLRARQVNTEVLCAAICTYLLLGLLFSFAYGLVSLAMPGAFAHFPASATDRPLRGFEALYFSFVTLSTVGYGDIVPVLNPARMLAMLEATSGTLYMTVLIARLVSLYAMDPPGQSTKQS